MLIHIIDMKHQACELSLVNMNKIIYYLRIFLQNDGENDMATIPKIFTNFFMTDSKNHYNIIDGRSRK